MYYKDTWLHRSCYQDSSAPTQYCSFQFRVSRPHATVKSILARHFDQGGHQLWTSLILLQVLQKCGKLALAQVLSRVRKTGTKTKFSNVKLFPSSWAYLHSVLPTTSGKHTWSFLLEVHRLFKYKTNTIWIILFHHIHTRLGYLERLENTWHFWKM